MHSRLSWCSPVSKAELSNSSHAGQTHVGDTWMPWRCARETSSCRNSAWDSLETVPCCNKSTCTETSGCRRAGRTGRGCSKGIFLWRLVGNCLSHHQHLVVLSPILTLNSNKHLKDNPIVP